MSKALTHAYGTGLAKNNQPTAGGRWSSQQLLNLSAAKSSLIV
ncbi:MAG: hypothetical protein ACFB2W_28155 [Leptolyngbyaceae cyanobacterium]